MPDPPAAPNTTQIAGTIGWLDVDVAVQQPADTAAGSPDPDKPGLKLTPETLLGVIGAAAAIGLWINVVGAGVLWARFDAAELPASQVVGIVPNSTLLGIGIRALVLPLLAAVVAVAVYYILTRRQVTEPVNRVRAAPFTRQFRLMWRAAWRAVKRVRREWSPAEAGDDSSDRREPSGAGPIGGVLVLLAALAFVAIFLMFGGDASTPKHPEYLIAWAIASPFLVIGAATYDPVNRALARRRWWPIALASLAVASALLIVLGGVVAGELRASLPVAALPFIAAALAAWLPPGYRAAGVTAGTLLLLVYLIIGAVLYFAGGGELTFDPGDQGVPLVVTILLSTLALLFLFSVDARSRRFVTVAAVMFAVVAAWGGVAGFLREGRGDPTFELTALVRKPESLPNSGQRERSPVSGFLIARTGDSVLVATSSSATDPTWRILVVARDQIEAMSIGPSCEVNAENLAVADKLASELAAEGTGSPTACKPSR